MILLGVGLLLALAGIICAGVAVAPRFETPADAPPLVVMINRLGMVFVRLTADAGPVIEAMREAQEGVAAFAFRMDAALRGIPPRFLIHTAGGILDVVDLTAFDAAGDAE